MKIRIIGGGPAGLYFAALMKREDASHDIVVYERGPRDATWGFGVVFSDRALEFLRADDEAMYRLLTPLMETWPDLTIVHNDTRIPIAGNGFAAIGRLELLSRLYAHAEALGVRIEFDSEMTSLDDAARLGGADLIVAANGAFSWVRNQHEDRVRHGNRPAQQPLHLVRHPQGLRQPVADLSAAPNTACSAPTITATARA
jgi:2-polyprenyl-6-methoxyphenol hydroxylase-like FAD-dependent oxidoreductase